jgi:hypothetical protein
VAGIESLSAPAAQAIARVMGMRIPENRAKQYEKNLRDGSTLISVHAPNADRLKQAMDILAAGGAEDLHEVVETSAAR